MTILEILTIIYNLIMLYLMMAGLCYILLLVFSIVDILQSFKEYDVSKHVSYVEDFPIPPVTVIIPVFNGGALLIESINSILKSKGNERISIIVVNDGSTDDTLYELIHNFQLEQFTFAIQETIKVHGALKKHFFSKSIPNLLVMDKYNGGKSDALNCALNICRTPLFITIDDDVLLEPETIYNMVLKFFTQDHMVAVGGALYILNGCKYSNGMLNKAKTSSNGLVLAQSCEYLRSFVFGRQAWNQLGGSLCFPGALTLFETHAALEVGGFEYKNFSQDFEIIAHLHEYRLKNKYPLRIRFAPGATAWTRVPDSWSELWKQRSNWQYGSLLSMHNYKNMLFNYKYGTVGLITFPFFLFCELLTPVVAFTGYLVSFFGYMLGAIDLHLVVLFLLISIGLNFAMTLATFIMGYATYNKYPSISDFMKLLWGVLLENLCINQFLIICRAIASFKFWMRRKI